MAWSIVSDLHLDSLEEPLRPILAYPPAEKSVRAPYLAVLGDLCSLHDIETWQSYFNAVVPRYRQVVYVAGNHEYYCEPGKRTYSTDCLLDSVRYWAREKWPGRLHVLQNEALEVDGVRVLGTTLWSHVPLKHRAEVQRDVRDYHKIYTQTSTPEASESEPQALRLVTVEDTNRWHEESLAFLKQELASHPQQPTMVLSHHAPLVRGTSAPAYERPGRAVSRAFATDLSSLIVAHPQLRLWGFGHTHWRCQFQFHHCTIVSHPRGYSYTQKVDPGEPLCITQGPAACVPAEHAPSMSKSTIKPPPGSWH